jgi:hypothetical protein
MAKRNAMVPAMKLILLAAALLACGPGRTTMARYPTSAPAFDRSKSDVKAVDLADKVVAAAGGMDKWNAVKQLRWGENVSNAGKVVIDGEEAWDRWNARHYGKVFGDHGDVVIKREIYGEHLEAYGEQGGRRSQLPPDDSKAALKIAQERWQFDTAALCMPFLLEEPGTKLTYTGQAQGDAGNLEVITVTFDAADPARAGTSYQVDIDPATNMIERLEVIRAGGNLGYKLGGWKAINGLKFPTTANNIGLATEVIAFKDIQISDPEDSLYVTF